jgi:hypothetical protein
MRITPAIAICVVLITISSAMASPRVGQRPEAMCTSDINLWGHASQCSCDTNTLYDERSGLCLQENDVQQIMIQGPVTTGVLAIGGESTGFSIKTSEGDLYELILKTADQEKLTKLNGIWLEIEGELISIDSVEIKGRKAIIVEKIAVLE